MDAATIWQLLRDAGLLAGLFVFIWLGMTKRIVFGWQYKELRADRDEWKELALEGTVLARKATRRLERDSDGRE